MSMTPKGSVLLQDIQAELSRRTTHIVSKRWLKRLLAFHNIDLQSSDEVVASSPYYKNGRWDLPVPDTAEWDTAPGVDDQKRHNDQIQRRFMDIFNDIIHHFSLGDTYRALATDATDDEKDDIHHAYGPPTDPPTPVQVSTRPDLVLLSRHISPQSLDSYHGAMSAKEERHKLYRGSLAVGKVAKVQRQLDSNNIASYDSDEAFAKVATCVRECFRNQPGRHFVYAFYVSLNKFRLFGFDRDGAFRVKAFNIHKNASLFVSAIRLTTSPDISTLGFDPNVHWEEGRQRVNVTEGGRTVGYEVEHAFVENPAMYGTVVTYWFARESGTYHNVLIKDKWSRRVYENREVSEGDIRSAVVENDLPGVARLVSADETPRTIASLRQSLGISHREFQPPVFTRVVLKRHGRTIRHFESGLQLLCTLRDAMHGHRRLVQCGILHRDINLCDILLGKDDAPEGQRGILTGFESAAWCHHGVTIPSENNRSINSAVLFSLAPDSFVFSPLTFVMEAVGDIEPGAPPFHQHDFLDDLESFFWVYVTAVSIFDGPSSTGEIHSHPDYRTLPAWHKAQSIRHLLDEREASIFNFYDGVTSPYFSHPPYTTLLHNLRILFKTYHEQMIYPREITSVDNPQDRWLNMDQIYDTVLGYFDSAILDLQKIQHDDPPLKQPTPILSSHREKRPLDDAEPPSQPTKKGRGARSRPAAPLKKHGRRKKQSADPEGSPRPPPAILRRSQRLKERKAKNSG